ncbi:Minf_1886 family protein [Crateriforma spongiae]|uniref:Minf_1886 family protein n=1 Tax=Crateriforma spongiae TaxID=2724528 RepID=UPI001444A5AD|nr:Minf_1886 family protein [Crateriforma spongiae]
MTSPLQAMRKLLKDDPRFKLEAYQFIRESLQYAHEHADQIRIGDMPTDADDVRHLTGQQLCEACRLYSLEQYGYLAKIVLNSWGVHTTSDLGEVVYNLIRIEQMRKSDTDRREDFDDVYDFDEAFQPVFELASSEE